MIFLFSRKCKALVALIIATLTIIGCGGSSSMNEPGITQVNIEEELYNNPPVINFYALPEVEQTEIDTMISNNNIFAFKLYHNLKDNKMNLIFSPYSISMVMAMTYAGSRGDTAYQIRDTLQFEIEQERLPSIFKALDSTLNLHFTNGALVESPWAFTSVDAWGQLSYPVQIDFFKLLATYYCGPIQPLDFLAEQRDSEEVIEEWVTEQTNGLITNAINSITERVRFAFVATTALDGNWTHPFDTDLTFDGPFELLNGYTVTVPIMTQVGYFPFTQDEAYKAIELSFNNSSLSMLLLIPESGYFYEFDNALDNKKIEQILDRLEPQELSLYLPKFSFVSVRDLNSKFSELGLTDAMVEGQADFSGINKSDDLYINSSRSKASISLTESSVQGGNSTIVSLEGREEIPKPEPGSFPIGVEIKVALPSITDNILIIDPSAKEVVLSRPFIFVIRDTSSGAIVFLGRVINPKGMNNF